VATALCHLCLRYDPLLLLVCSVFAKFMGFLLIVVRVSVVHIPCGFVVPVAAPRFPMPPRELPTSPRASGSYQVIQVEVQNAKAKALEARQAGFNEESKAWMKYALETQSHLQAAVTASFQELVCGSGLAGFRLPVVREESVL
jgi:hypothetical protein